MKVVNCSQTKKTVGRQWPIISHHVTTCNFIFRIIWFIYTEDIRECNGNWYCRVGNNFVLQSDSISFFGGCNEPTGSPSPSPTPRPTPRPTDPPTPSPSPAPTLPTAPPTTRAPTVVGYTYPPTSDPSRSPTAPTDAPTYRPTQMYEVSVTVGMGYEILNEEICDLEMVDWMESVVIFTDSYKESVVTSWDINYAVDIMVSRSFLYFRFAGGSERSQSPLDEFADILMSKKYQRQLKRYLEAMNMTIISEDDESNGVDANGDEGDTVMVLEECFDLRTQSDIDNEAGSIVSAEDKMIGTTEYLILILSVLVFCICLVVGCYFGIKNRRKNINAMKVSPIHRSPMNSGTTFVASGEANGAKVNKPKASAPRPPKTASRLRPLKMENVESHSAGEEDSDVDI